jgi:hypothetical protein
LPAGLADCTVELFGDGKREGLDDGSFLGCPTRLGVGGHGELPEKERGA